MIKSMGLLAMRNDNRNFRPIIKGIFPGYLILLIIIIFVLMYKSQTTVAGQKWNCLQGNCFDGEGTGENTAGLTYKGSWLSGVPHGYGEETSKDGTIKKGWWIDGYYHSSTNPYPEPYEEKFSFRASFQVRYTELRIHAQEDPGTGGANYDTNTPYRLGLWAAYQDFSISYNSNYLTIQKSEKYFGETEYTDVQINYHPSKWRIEGYYLDYKGHFKNAGETVFPWEKPSEPYFQRPDLRTVTYGGNLFYFEDRRFSYKAAFDLSERHPTGCAISTVYGLSASNLQITADGTIIDANNDGPNFKEDRGLSEANLTSFSGMYGLAGGYSKTFIYSVMFLIGIGAQYQDYEVATGHKTAFGWLYRFYARLNAGLDFKKSFMGFQILLEVTNMNMPQHNIEYLGPVVVEYYTGIRF